MHVIQCECGGKWKIAEKLNIETFKTQSSSALIFYQTINHFFLKKNFKCYVRPGFHVLKFMMDYFHQKSVSNRDFRNQMKVRTVFVCALLLWFVLHSICIIQNEERWLMFIYLILLFACSSCSSTTTNRNHFPLFLQYCFGSWLEHLNRSSLSTHSCPITRNASVNYNQCM